MSTIALNPWLSASPDDRASAPGAVQEAAPRRVRRAAALRPQPSPAFGDGLPRGAVQERPERPTCWFVGAHGGAGETTLASLFEGGLEAQRSWPSYTGPSAAEANVVIVARSHSSGMRAAQELVTEWAAGLVPSVQLLGLAVMADAPGKLPRSLAHTVDLVAGGSPRIWQVPWVEAWRHAPARSGVALPRAVRRLLDDLAELTR